ncbi:N-formylglutamate deformylase [Aquibaculum sediminis]|uniref:N-formylglutamate deformylase n=1 Tax=Aquibaculum sediminis TaxID=3231907 RepID=UPI0034567B7A
MEAFRFKAGPAPLLVSMPHVGTHVPDEIAARLTADALTLSDTDWHVDRLYDFLDELGASVLTATHSRYVIDLNRHPEGRPLYPGASNTELCPTSSFANAPLYRPGQAPDESEVAERRQLYWQPYHDRLAACLAALQAEHGRVLLWDAHSICSRVPRFFEGQLPDLNIGSGGGVTVAPSVIDAVAEAAQDPEYNHVLDGRFKGGYITRHYGNPEQGVHAVQLELSWATYMDEAPPFAFRDDLAAGIRPVLRRMVEAGLGALEAAG